jgi:head-tail adaptor
MGTHRFISQSDLAYIRQFQEDNLFDTCVVERPTTTNNGYGGWTNAWATIATYDCRFWISSGPSGTSQESKFWGNQEVSNTVGFITLKWDADVQVKDRITWTSTETGDVRELYITGIQRDDTFVTATRCRVESLRT